MGHGPSTATTRQRERRRAECLQRPLLTAVLALALPAACGAPLDRSADGGLDGDRAGGDGGARADGDVPVDADVDGVPSADAGPDGTAPDVRPTVRVRRVAAGQSHVCVLSQQGSVCCAGRGPWLGTAGARDSDSLVAVPGLEAGVVDLSASFSHTCALKEDGSVWCWGDGSCGGLGDGTAADIPYTDFEAAPPVRAHLPGPAETVGVSGWQACSRLRDGSASCWGYNAHGNLGDGTYEERHEPVQVVDLGAGIVQLSVGGGFSCGVTLDRQVWCWGSHVMPSVVGVEYGPRPVLMEGLGSEVASVEVGGNQGCTLRRDGTVWCWGFGYLGAGDDRASEVPVQVESLGDRVVQLAAGFSHFCARTTDGALWCWGNNVEGAVGLGEGVHTAETPMQVASLGFEVADVRASGHTTCAILEDGRLYCWGEFYGRVFGEGVPAGIAHTPTPVPDSLECGEPVLY